LTDLRAAAFAFAIGDSGTLSLKGCLRYVTA